MGGRTSTKALCLYKFLLKTPFPEGLLYMFRDHAVLSAIILPLYINELHKITQEVSKSEDKGIL